MSPDNQQTSPRMRHSGEVCCIPICDRLAAKGALCSAHYQRLRKTGDTRPDVPFRPKQTKWGINSCAVEDCGLPSRKRGWCMSHYERWNDHGDPLYEGIPQGHKRVHNGYMLVFSGGTAPPQAEHRLVWEAKHGPLLPGQNIHHKNGGRIDNRYENLEVWDTAQPAGQRPEDKVEFAIQMLERYAPELLCHVRPDAVCSPP